ncbi:MAG: rhodanese-like domain-containing protein [Candidatus Poribacteria bacterium]|nr:rhodanese-like domain-containing protein [Candidatus Poribacteria bacterium]
MKKTYRCIFFLLTVLLLQTSFASHSTAQAPPEDVQRITVADLKARLDAGDDVVIIDVRIKGAYDNGHIQNAVSMPISDIATRHQELKNEPFVVFY